MITLSKSEYIMYLKHPAWLWLKKHDKKMLPEVDDNLQARFDAGNLFEQFAEKRFKGVVRVGFDNYQEYLSMPERTHKALREGAKILSQGRFETNFAGQQITCIVDIVELVGEKTFDLYEIKSSTKVKADHIEDLAFQVAVLEGAGYRVRNIGVVFCNNQYVRHGALDELSLSVQQDVTSKVRQKLDTTKRNIEAALKVVESTEMPDPTPRRTKMGAIKDWLEIFLALRPTEDKYSIYNLCSAAPEQLGQLEDMHISSIADIPNDFTLKPKQKRQVEATKLGEPIVDIKKIKRFMNSLEYPLYFLDYETLSSIVPPFDGTKPFDQIPFQYSLHIIEKPGGDLLHKEFLHTLDTNPVPELVKQLQNDIGERGTVLVWWEGFEKTCNDLMGKLLPEYAKFLEDVNSRVIDLMKPFSEGYYIDSDFMGSASIKNVLPVIAPELSYKDMDIQEGGSAQRLWMQSVYEDKFNDIEKAKLMESLRQYCELDTYAMVRIFEFLNALVYNGDKYSVVTNQGQAANQEFEQQSLF